MSLPSLENSMVWIASCPSTCWASASRVSASNISHLPKMVPTAIIAPLTENAQHWICSPMSLLHTTECDNESHSWSSRSRPPVTNCGIFGWTAIAHTSSVWPMMTGENPKSKLPVSIQFRVVPMSNWEPFPSAIMRTAPKCCSTSVSMPVGLRSESNNLIRPSLPPPVRKLPSFNVHSVKIEPSCTFLNETST